MAGFSTGRILTKLLESDKFAAIAYQSTFNTLDKDTACQLQQIGEPIPLQYFMSMGLPKGK